MWHTVFITVHAVAGGVAFVAGCVALPRGALFGTYLWSMAVMALFLALAVATEWGVIPMPLSLVFAALTVLAGYMVWRAAQARRIRPTARTGPSTRYVAHIGFTLVALFDAFAVITVLNAGAPGWLVAAAGVLIAVAGHFVLRAARSRLVPAPAPVKPLAASLDDMNLLPSHCSHSSRTAPTRTVCSVAPAGASPPR
ncbi:MAG: hypothetical protein GEU83_04960 [Pseudonocardiaceae bacterium]|nr:hypothetical protein [Pseudonocardiaceae bacterium]